MVLKMGAAHLNSRLVVERNGALAFPLAVLSEWLAAQSLLEGTTFPREISKSRPDLERWRYPLIIALSVCSQDQAEALLIPIVEQYPAFASQLLHEALSGHDWENEVPAPPATECGRGIRAAMQAWITGIGPLASLIAPLDEAGRLRPIGVRTHGLHLESSWYHGNALQGEVLELPYGIFDSMLRSHKRSWHEWPRYRSSQPGRQGAWAWQWTLDEVIDRLGSLIKKCLLPMNDGPLRKEYIWKMVCDLSHKGSFYSEPLPVSGLRDLLTLVESLNGQPPEGIINNYRVEEIRKVIAEYEHCGDAFVNPPWLGPDLSWEELNRPALGWIWSRYSDEGLLEHARFVWEAALEGYQKLVATWFPTMAQELWTATMLPARIIGYVTPPQRDQGFEGAPRIRNYFLALPLGSTTTVEFQLGEPPKVDTIFDEMHENLRRFRPQLPHRTRISGSGTDFLHQCPATELCYRWLKDDLKEVSFLPSSLI
jgi:hypothetical protein